MTRQTRSKVGRSSMMAESLQSIGAAFLISREQSRSLLPSQISEQVSTLGGDGSLSTTDIIATLTRWYDTLPTREREKFWTLILDYYMLGTPLGTPSRDLNSY